MARTRYGFFPQPGTNYSVGQEPTIAARLDRLGKALKLQLLGVSGYRSPAHSVAVGGFANDPHTRGQASDTPGIESVPERTLQRFGLTRPFPGSSEADHIQLLLGRGSPSTNPRRPSGTQTLASLWRSAGGPGNLAPVMAAIAEAESGGRVDAVGGPNSDGSYDYGLWQINSSHTQFDRTQLLSDPLYNARAAVSVWRSQGLTAWSTYTSGAYTTYTGAGATGYAPTFGRTRPGGESSGDSSGFDNAIANAYGQGGAGSTEDVSLNIDPIPGGPNIGIPIPGIPSIPNPLDLFKDVKGTADAVVAFAKWIIWLFNPKHLLQVVEFLTGFTLIIFGIHIGVKAHFGDREPGAIRKAASTATLAIPGVGEEVAAVKGARAGKRAASAEKRRKSFEGGYKRGKRGQTRKTQLREADKRFGKDAPF